tara:strand:- start:454 stop:1623 length:1170 start_codon:yes stop_codon:yes gene_type:complete
MHKKRGFFANHKFGMATATLIGTIVGAGVLGIPYVIAKSGFLYGTLLIFFVGLAFLFLNLFIGEIVLRTKGKHQLTGYMEKYLGPWGKNLMMFSMVFGIYGALTAYLIGEGQVLKSILGGQAWIYSLIFFVIVSIIIFKGVKAMGKVELVVITLLVLVVILIGLFSFDKINLSNLSTFNPAFFFLPYGVILFAFIGTASVPEMKEQLENEKRKLKKALVWGSVIPVLLYVLFSFIVISIVGLSNFELLSANQRIATVALSVYANPTLGLFANIFAIFTMFTTFLTLGVALMEMYEYDYHLKRSMAFALTMILPLGLALSGFTTFIATLGITGAIAGGVDGILIVLAYWKAKKFGNRKPEYSMNVPKFVGVVLILMFALGILYQLWQKLM